MAAETARSRVWLWLTLTCTAGAMLAAVWLAPAAGAAPGLGLTWLLFIGSSSHVAATAWFYTLPEVRDHARRHPTRYVRIPLALVIAGGALAAALPLPVLRWSLLPFFAWQFFHFQKQNLGMAALAASAHRVPTPRPAERRALIAAGLAGIAGLAARPWLLQLAPQVQLTLRPLLAWLYPAAALAFGVAVLAGLAALARRPAAHRPTSYCVMYTISLAFSLPVFLLSSPYAAVAGLTIAHGLQYLLIVGLVAAGGQPGPGRTISLALLTSTALAGGALLAMASHLHSATPALRIGYGAYLGAVMAHFVVDAGLWRLRDDFPRAFLASRIPYLVPAAAAPAPGSLATPPIRSPT